jgi:hypothetical protein
MYKCTYAHMHTHTVEGGNSNISTRRGARASRMPPSRQASFPFSHFAEGGGAAGAAPQPRMRWRIEAIEYSTVVHMRALANNLLWKAAGQRAQRRSRAWAPAPPGPPHVSQAWRGQEKRPSGSTRCTHTCTNTHTHTEGEGGGEIYRGEKELEACTL